MKAVIQRVKRASVTINNEVYSKIDQGILVLLGVEKNDTKEEAEYIAQKISKLRIFEDQNNKMNLSVKDIKGEILVVSQFTLAGSCKKGTRPSFENSAKPEAAIEIYKHLIERLKALQIPVKTGQFGAMMDIELINNGPVTFVLSKKKELNL